MVLALLSLLMVDSVETSSPFFSASTASFLASTEFKFTLEEELPLAAAAVIVELLGISNGSESSLSNSSNDFHRSISFWFDFLFQKLLFLRILFDRFRGRIDFLSCFFSGELAEPKGRRFTAAMTLWNAARADLDGFLRRRGVVLLKFKCFFACCLFFRSISMRNRTVLVQHCLLGNDLKPLDEQELKSSSK